MRLLLDEMYSVAVAEQLRDRGHDVVSVNDSDYAHLRAAADADVFRAAISEGRAVVTENVRDFAALEADALSTRFRPVLVYTTHRQFPRRGKPAVGRLVSALAALLERRADLPPVYFLEPADER